MQNENSRPLTIQIPKPDEDGDCHYTCKLLPCCPYMVEKEEIEDSLEVIAIKPGPGCPWFSEAGGKDE